MADCFSSWCPSVVGSIHRKKGRGGGERRQEEEIENKHRASSAGKSGNIWGSVPGQEDNIEGKMVWDAPVLREGLQIIGPNGHLRLNSRFSEVGHRKVGSSKIMK